MNRIYQKIIEKLGAERFKFDEPMAEHTTFKIGGSADLFVEVEDEEDLQRILTIAEEEEISFFILGGGSNILIGDKGFRGLIIKLSNCELKFANNTILAGAGVPIAVLLNECKKNSLTGLEYMAGIPGTVGGSVRGNAGAWQNGIGEKTSRVKVLTEDREIKWISREECQFNYRDSRFKHNKEIILAAEFFLEKGDEEEISRLIEENFGKRANQPKEPSAGCVFVNPKPLSAGKLIEDCGLKGKTIGRAQISEKHANFIINPGGAKATDVVLLIELIKKTVKEKFNVSLKEEIVMIGEF